MVQVQLTPQGPFDLSVASTVLRSFPPLAHQPGPTADGVVRLGFVLDRSLVPVAVAIHPEGDRLRCEIAGTTDGDAAARQVARIFSLDHDGSSWPAVGERDPRIGALQRALSWLRPVCFTSPYECACWAVLSQRIGKAQAVRIVAALVEAHGHRVALGERTIAVFPAPERMLEIDALPGVAAVKIDRLHAVARAAADGILDADRLRSLGDTEGPASLRAIAGIGPFWSSGIYLRAAGIADVFPDEPMSIAALGRLHGLSDAPSPAAREHLTAPYRPYRMWACFLLRDAANRGLIPDG